MPAVRLRGITVRGRLRDLALGVPGEFHLALCGACGLLFQDPRVRADQLELVYPDHYDPHARTRADPHAQKRGRAGRWVLAPQLGYAQVRTDDVRIADRLIAGRHGRRMREEFRPWRGQGRFLDVCASGRFIRQMSEITRAGGRVIGARHRTKPRYLIRSLHHLLTDRSGPIATAGLAVAESRLGRGALKLGLEALLPLARRLRLGEAVRHFIVPA